jgi:hypothetical protein
MAMKGILLFLLPLSLLASVEDEAKIYAQQLKNKQVEEELQGLEQFRACKEKFKDFGKDNPANDTNQKILDARNAEIKKCMNEVLQGTNEQQAKKIAESLDLYNYDLVPNKTEKSIKDYLIKRFDKMVHGKEEPNSLKEQKYISNKKFFEIYRSQLDKGILFEISAYCLERLRVEGKTGEDAFIQPECSMTPASGVWSGCFVSGPNGEKVAKAQFIDSHFSNLKELVGSDYDYTNVATDPNSFQAKTQKELDEFVKKEFARGAEYLQAKYAVCASTIKRMCDRYECEQTIANPGAVPLCKDTYNIRTSKNPTYAGKNATDISDIEFKEEDGGKGRVACNLVTTLRNFRKAYSTTGKLIEYFEKQNSGGSGFDVGTTFGGVYTGKGDDGIEAITTVSSGEITANEDIAEFDEASEKADELKSNCTGANANSEICKEELDFDYEDKIANIEVDAAAQYGIKMKEVEALKGNTAGLKEFLEKNGMMGLLNKLEKNELTEPELVDALDAKFKAEQLAMISTLKKDFGGQKQIAKDAGGGVIGDSLEKEAEETANELKTKKARISTLLQYNNIVTSFLEYGEDKKQNARAFQREVKDLQEFNPDAYSDYEGYFNDLEGQQSGGGSDDRPEVGLDFIDAVLNGASIDSN